MKSREVFHVDLETRSKANLRDVGVHEYARHPSTEILLFGGALDERPVFCIDLLKTQGKLDPRIANRLGDPNVLKTAFNSSFEVTVLREQYPELGIDHSQWLDVQSYAGSLALPQRLEDCARVFYGEDDPTLLKDTKGKNLINVFSKWRGAEKGFADPREEALREHWVDFTKYCAQDVALTRRLFNDLRPYAEHTYTAFEHRVWLTDQNINDRGIPVDMRYVELAMDYLAAYLKMRGEDAKRISGLDNPNSIQQLSAWLQTKGIKVDNLQKQTVKDLLAGDIDRDVAEVLRIRLESGAAGVKKFKAMLDRGGSDGRLRGEYRYFRASTGRWGGAGVQVQNLQRGIVGAKTVADTVKLLESLMDLVVAEETETIQFLYSNVVDAVGSTIRPSICAPEDQHFIVADYSSIETAVIGWLAGEKKILDLMHNGGDPYKDMATEVFSVGYDDVNKSQRTYCKPVVLGGVFGMGGAAYQKYAAGYGVELEEEEAYSIIRLLRGRYTAIKQLWDGLDFAFREVLSGGFNIEVPYRGLTLFRTDERFVFMRLPSGRCLSYPNARFNDEGQIVCDALREGKWCEVKLYGGRLAQNATQATARDLLANALVNAEAAGFEIVMHTHDEMIALEDIGDDEHSLDTLRKTMCLLPDWAEGIPIDASGFVSRRYLKD